MGKQTCCIDDQYITKMQLSLRVGYDIHSVIFGEACLAELLWIVDVVESLQMKGYSLQTLRNLIQEQRLCVCLRWRLLRRCCLELPSAPSHPSFCRRSSGSEHIIRLQLTRLSVLISVGSGVELTLRAGEGDPNQFLKAQARSAARIAQQLFCWTPIAPGTSAR